MRCRPANHEDQLTRFGTCWLLVPTVQELGYLEITDVDTSLDKVVVKGDADWLSGLGQRYWLIAPAGVDPATGALETDPCKMGSLWLWAGYHYRAPIVGFHTTPPSQSAGTYGAQTGNNKLGSYYCNNRIYEPSTGRWTTPDPAMSPWTNLWDYVRTNSVSRTDPSGLTSLGMEGIKDYLEWKRKWEDNRGVDAGEWEDVKDADGRSGVGIWRAEECDQCGKECTFTFTTIFKVGSYILGGKTVYGASMAIGFSSKGINCCGCENIKFYQAVAETEGGEVVKPYGNQAQAHESDNWFADVDMGEARHGGAYPGHSQYHDKKNGMHKLVDAPGWYRGLNRNRGKKFHTCAICEKEDGSKLVLACLKWSFSIDNDGKVSGSIDGAACGPTGEFKSAMKGWNNYADQYGKLKHGIALD